MDSGGIGYAGVPLVKKVRLAMALADRSGASPAPRRAVVRRDVGGLLDRLERLRMAFPDVPELVERVGLSPHVLSLLHEVQPATASCGGGGRLA